MKVPCFGRKINVSTDEEQALLCRSRPVTCHPLHTMLTVSTLTEYTPTAIRMPIPGHDHSIAVPSTHTPTGYRQSSHGTVMHTSQDTSVLSRGHAVDLARRLDGCRMDSWMTPWIFVRAMPSGCRSRILLSEGK